MTQPVFCFIGPPCAGKSTIAKALAQEFSECQLISAGDVARELAEGHPEVERALSRGEMALEHLMNFRMRLRLYHMQSEIPIILDGYPRYMEQLADLLMAVDSKCLIFVIVRVLGNIQIERYNTREKKFEGNLGDMLQTYDEKTQPVIQWINDRQSKIRKIHISGDEMVSYNTGKIMHDYDEFIMEVTES